MFHSLYTQVASAALFSICLFAIVAGSWRERLCGVIYLAAYIMQFGLHAISSNQDFLHLALADILLVPGFLVIARKSPHPWAICALGLQIFSVGLDIAALVFKNITRWQYLTIGNGAGYAVLLCLLVGTFAAQARRRAEKQASR
jgi:hypothetical protein